MVTLSELTSKNLWWETPDTDFGVSNFPKRDLYTKIQENLNHPLMLNIVGLRRVGKSVLLRQIAEHLLTWGVESKHVFYFLFDYANQLQTPEYLDEVLGLYLREVLKVKGYNVKERVYILLDEIQYIDNWQAVLKKYYDLSFERIKFIITGSQSLLLANKNKESLAGRIFDYYLPPLSLAEFLTLSEVKVKLPPKIDFLNMESSYNNIKMFNAFHGKDIYDKGCEYMIGGQFPKTIQLPTTEQRHEYIVESVMGKVIEDCIKIFDIDKTDEFKLVARHLLNNAGSLFEPTNIGREVGLTLITMNKYLEYLREAHLFEIFYRHHKSLIKRGRMLKKLYSTCVNFTCALNHYKIEDVDRAPDMFGKVVENLVFNALKYTYPEKTLNDSLSFWRQEKEEIDFLIIQDGKQVPIEVKFTNKLDKRELKCLVNYVETQKLEYGVVITKDELDKKQLNGQTIYFIPYYLALLIV